MYITGLNHNTEPVDLREKLSFTGEKFNPAVNELMHGDTIDELVLLSTCNRTEFIFRSEHHGQQKVIDFLSKEGNIDASELKDYIYELDDFEALQHLFRVASGLNSLVLGETQILGQVKTAFDIAIEQKTSSGNFLQIYQQMLQCAKAVRRETEIGRGSLSVSFIAVQLAKNIFSSFHDKNVLLIGAGEMCDLAGVHFNEAGVANIDVANRSLDKAQALANKFSGRAYSLDELEEACANADIILSSTGAQEYVLTYDIVSHMYKKRQRPLFLIDIAVPRDIDPKVNDINDVFLYNIDALNKIAQENQQTRNHAAEEAERIVEAQIEDYRDNLYIANLGPIISSLQQRSHEFKGNELARLFRRNEHFSVEDQKAIEQSVNLIVNKILHEPIISLREGVKKERSSRIINVFKDFFNL